MLKYLVLTAIFYAVQITGQIRVNKILEVGQPYEFTNPLYPIREPTKDLTHEWNFEVDGDAKIKIVCDDIRMTLRYDWPDDCPYVYLNVRDGNIEKKICGRGIDNFVYKSNESKLQIQFKTSFGGSGIFKCTATRFGDAIETEMIELKRAGKPVRIDVNKIDLKRYIDRQWSFKSPKGTRISYNCQISITKIEPICGKELIIFNNGENDEELCNSGANVLFSKINKSSIRYQVPEESDGYFECVVQAITGSHVNEFQNIPPVEKQDSSEHGLLVGDQTFNAQPQTNCECGWTNKARGRIINGQETDPNEFPWMVNILLRWVYNETFEWSDVRCGASIITPRHVLTAAHCIDAFYEDIIPPENVKVIIGRHHTQDPTEHEKIIGANEIHVTDLYLQKRQFYQDIAIIVTNETIEFNRFIGPVCIEPENYDLLHKQILLLGWGIMEGNIYSPVLRKGNILVVDNFFCSKADWDLCARNIGEGSACSGDSGGPIVALDPDTNRYMQVSVVSRVSGNKTCLDFTISTRVASFYDWIQEIIKATVPTVNTCHKI